MNYKEALVIAAVIALPVFIATYAAHAANYFTQKVQPQALGNATSQCDVTETTVAIGHQAATTVLAAGSYQWIKLVQPINASNTVSTSLGGTAVSGRGDQLTPATSTSPVPSLVYGFAPNMPYRGAITAKTSTGSSTINVVSCR